MSDIKSPALKHSFGMVRLTQRGCDLLNDAEGTPFFGQGIQPHHEFWLMSHSPQMILACPLGTTVVPADCVVQPPTCIPSLVFLDLVEPGRSTPEQRQGAEVALTEIANDSSLHDAPGYCKRWFTDCGGEWCWPCSSDIECECKVPAALRRTIARIGGAT